MKTLKWLVALSVPLIVSGCFENNNTTEKLCNNNPDLRCDQLNMNDGQCRLPRTDLIWHRFEVKKNPTDGNKIKEYEFVAAYSKCLELASQIAPIDQTLLKQKRFNALIHSIAEKERIAGELKNSTAPNTLYFLWSQIGSDNARRKFLRLEGTKQLETAELQYALATFYTTRDKPKTISLLHNALVLTKPDKLNSEIVKSLASINQSLGYSEHSYIWAIVGKEFEVPIASERDLQRMYGFDQEKVDRLNTIAENIADEIKDGNYSRNMLPKIDKLQ
ncbi:DUF2989 domain-containing protein [Vibrio genomosp. F6]|uniref:DUF2989 domain-containing protein n=1 Tax=Vibrio genomosp. F6 TaxID=723172 RepID=UPI0010BD70D8|nr:DUF2989 domain-containing protein [Vibrio genomosp. F6]TKF22582.1 DUF2989 domain-containing protein [Vibrio genomosp. F6]